MGFDCKRFKVTVGEHLICIICNKVLEDPVQHINMTEYRFYCELCISKWIETEKDCPTEKYRTLYVREVPKKILISLEELEISCDFTGCAVFVKLKHLKDHGEGCQFNPKPTNEYVVFLNKSITELKNTITKLQQKETEQIATLQENHRREIAEKNEEMRSLQNRRFEVVLEMNEKLCEMKKEGNKAIAEKNSEILTMLKHYVNVIEGKNKELVALQKCNNHVIDEKNLELLKSRESYNKDLEDKNEEMIKLRERFHSVVADMDHQITTLQDRLNRARAEVAKGEGNVRNSSIHNSNIYFSPA